jgi:hypothetical protein
MYDLQRIPLDGSMSMVGRVEVTSPGSLATWMFVRGSAAIPRLPSPGESVAPSNLSAFVQGARVDDSYISTISQLSASTIIY